MQFIVQDLGQRDAGDVVEFNLRGNQANVLLLDSTNYASFKRNGSFRGVGGLAKATPVHLSVPQRGHWFAVAYHPSASVTASIRLI